MEWNDIFPILGDRELENYLRDATEEERKLGEEWFGVERIINPQVSGHVVATSLFWKNVDTEDPDLPELTLDLLKNAKSLGLVKRFEPWDHYILPLLEGAKQLNESRPDVVVRVYLAKDLEFLLDPLSEFCEIRLMRSSSIRHSPGSLWRFLAIEDTDGLLTLADSDNMRNMEFDIDITKRMGVANLGFWRRPNIMDIDYIDNKKFMIYRSIVASRFGTGVRLPVRDLMEAFIWHTLKGNVSTHGTHPVDGVAEFFGRKWPGYCFDEWFLMCALYPRLAPFGCLTYLNDPCPSHLFPLDQQYLMRVNSRSEIMF